MFTKKKILQLIVYFAMQREKKYQDYHVRVTCKKKKRVKFLNVTTRLSLITRHLSKMKNVCVHKGNFH